jgi:tetratricopeptide (TPR) repeat protein
MSKLVAAYEFGMLPDEERAAFEQHVLECDACFQELERGAAVVSVLRERAREYEECLGEQRSPLVRQQRRRAFRWPVLRIAAPACAVAVLAVMFLLRRPPGPADYRDFATFPQEGPSSTLVRGLGAAGAVSELVEAGLAHLDVGDFEQAELRFEAAVQRDSTSVEGLYLLGLSRALQGEFVKAVPSLEAAADLAPENLLPKVTWTLANAYVKAGMLEEARVTLRRLVADTDEFAEKGRDLLERLPD